MLGFAPGELDGRSLFTLLPCGRADERVLRRMIDRREPDPFLLRLRCKHGGAVELLLYRRFDEYDGSIFIAASPPDGAVMPTQDRASGDRTHP
jgi:hypothetical protein